MNKEFKWDDSLIKEFLSENFFSYALNQTLEERLNKFKESKQPKPEWEILKYRQKSGFGGILNATAYKLESPMDINDFNIYSVKRLSDGEVFTIGDISGNSYSKYTISGFQIIDDKLYANWEEGGLDRLSDLRKAKEILFTSQDGKPIYKDDKFYYVDKSFRINEYWADSCWTPVQDGLEFSTKENAEEYILMNKPLFSVNEIMKFIGGTFYRTEFINKAKEKLNKP